MAAGDEELPATPERGGAAGQGEAEPILSREASAAPGAPTGHAGSAPQCTIFAEAEALRLEGEGRGEEGATFALAFGGGGVRAAAFDCGALWALSDRGMLGAVTHLGAVSGGSYAAAAYATHLRAALGDGEPMAHRRAVSGTVLRFQRNVGYLVSCEPPLWAPRPDGSAKCPCWPRWQPRGLDGPALGLLIIMMLCTSPTLYLTFVAFPFAQAADWLAGASLRSNFCAAALGLPSDAVASEAWFDWWTTWAYLFAVAACGVVALAIGTVAVPRRPPRFRLFLYWHESRRLVTRLSLLVVATGLVTLLTRWAQQLQWSDSELAHAGTNTTRNRAACISYIRGHAGGNTTICGDWHTSDFTLWYESEPFRNEWNTSEPVPPFSVGATADASLGYLLLFLCLGCLAVGAWGLAFGLNWLGPLIAFWAPLFGAYITAVVTQWKVYGPVTGQPLAWDAISYSDNAWRVAITTACAVAVVLLPLYGVIFRFVHWYFRTRLCRAFFHDGQDAPLASFAAQLSEPVPGDPRMPVFLFGATLNDFRRPTDPEGQNSSTFVFTPHTMGGERVGYVALPQWFNISRAVAISGAAVDALILHSMGTFAMRAWMALLSLAMGDWVRFAQPGAGKHEHASVPGRTHAPQLALLMLAYCLFGSTAYLYKTGEADDGYPGLCSTWDTLTLLALFVVLLVFAASFYAFEPKVAPYLLASPAVREVHTLLAHPLCSAAPPPFVYLTDGGTTDDLCLVHLLRRRPRWLLVCDTGDDPTVHLIDLRTSIALARQERVCSFYDPRDPRRDLEQALQEYTNGTAPWLHLGVHYGWAGAAEGEQCPPCGDLLLVRMRLPGDDETPVLPLVTAEELEGGPAPQPDPTLGRRAEFGTFCCEMSRRCCSGFPNIGTANQFFTPLLFANYCRLGRELVSEALEKLCALQAADAAAAQPQSDSARGTTELGPSRAATAY
eukprot:TRINITY_DN9608_c0_g6_i1.p1 TRINITY_DN9608_c0_g6~~TRINITY_DN9608_c0_g6_i1.p1  ORF type:complete len:976 (+),score=282.44 TRINITY_DN9608_c0_g6_i1:78-2930(+)